MDETICPKCGKANLLSDIKCRYCQALLERTRDGLAAESPQDAEIPEWLKRIRELKKLDEEREKEKEKWRQQTLFGQNNNQQKQKNKAPEKKSGPIKQNENIPANQTKSSRNPQKMNAAGVKPLFHSDKIEASKTNPESDDLPEGFHPLSIDEDNP